MRILTLIAFVFIAGSAFMLKPEETTEVGEINWMTWSEAIEANKQTPKKIFVDVYTNWCGWCKKMDKTTFQDPKVVSALNQDFYAVKFNAEQKEAINFNGSDFKFVNQGRRGVHQLAYALLDGRLGYPAFVFLDESFSRIMLSPGYKQPAQLMKEINFAAEEIYKETSWEEYSSRAE
ncbi:MAG: DUF255 domain-containing protein [Saprospiraceae bacterium]|nr:DUF255 domain-containing protein [Saprospiraceae bacterium]